MWTSEFDLIGLSLFAAALLVLPALLTWARMRAVERRLEGLDGQLGVFTEASIELAKSVGGHPIARNPGDITAEASRRYVLHRAKERVADGEEIDRVLGEMGVAGDERRLMDIAQRGCDGRYNNHVKVAV